LSIIDELRRRNVLRVGAAYLVVAWLLIQVAETIFPLFGFDETPARIVVVVLAIGFIPSLVFAWVFEVTPDGLRKEKDLDRASYSTPRPSRNLDRLIMVALAIALGYFAFDRFVLTPEREATMAEAARREGRSEALSESYGDRSIVILPFRDMSPDGDQEYLSDGIAEELLNVLANVPEIRVISRTSAFAFKGKGLEAPEIARRLNVGHVLEGSVRKAGHRIRITAQLIDAQSDTHLWSRRWDREMNDVFAVEDEIARSVLQSLKATLLAQNTGRNSKADITEPDPRAHELFLKGNYLVTRYDPEAESFFEQAIAIDPHYARAYAGLAKSLLQPAPDTDDSEKRRDRAAAALDHALELDPDESYALSLKGLMLWSTNLGKARESWKSAIATNPNNSDAWRWLGLSYQESDSRRYLENIRQAYFLDPTIAIINAWYAEALTRFGSYREALAVARDFHKLDPASAWAYGLAGDIHRTQSRLDEALKSEYLAFSADPESSVFADAGWVLADLGEFALMESWARKWGEIDGSDEPTHVAQLAVALFYQGRQTEALHLLSEAAAQTGSPELYAFLGHHQIELNGDYDNARVSLEESLLPPGQESVHIDPEKALDWMGLTAYAMALQHTGAADRATTLVAELRSIVDRQNEAGLISHRFFSVRFLSAMINAISGNGSDAINDLSRADAQGVFYCLTCVRHWPQFSSLHGIPEFEALVAKGLAGRAVQRQRLADQGMLLTPEQVLQRRHLDYDPFGETGVSEK